MIGVRKIGVGLDMSKGITKLMDPGKGTFDSGTEEWVAYGSNTIANDSGALKITHVDSANGAKVNLNAASDLNANLVIGVDYRVKIRCKRDTDSSQFFYVSGPNEQSSAIPTSYTWLTIDFTATSTTANLLRCSGMGGGASIWVDKWYIYKL